METALARLRAKTDYQLGILVARQLERSGELSVRGSHRDAARSFMIAESWLAVANIPPPERARLERRMQKVRQTIQLSLSAVA